MKRFLYIAIILSLLMGCSLKNIDKLRGTEGALNAHFIDVGQGRCIGLLF